MGLAVVRAGLRVSGSEWVGLAAARVWGGGAGAAHSRTHTPTRRPTHPPYQPPSLPQPTHPPHRQERHRRNKQKERSFVDQLCVVKFSVVIVVL